MNGALYFEAALKLAAKARKMNEVPIGAVLVKDGKVIAKAHNQTESKNSFLAHAEIICLIQASKKLSTKYLSGTTLYVTLEPCKMCEAAAKLSRVESIRYLLPSKKFGRSGIGYRRISRRSSRGPLRNESAKLLSDFFKEKR